jgi:hypothetical protein
MAEIVGSLFGITPDLYERQLRAQDEDRAIRMANLAPGARGAAMIQSGAAGLTRGIGGLLGAEDPQMKLISARQQIMSQTDQSDPQSLANAAKQLSSIGDQQGAMALLDFARKTQSEMALIGQRKAAEQSSLASAIKTQLGIKQEEQLRDELSKLGPNATQEQILSVVTKYGSPDKVLASLQGSADRAAQRDTTLLIAREKIDAEIKKAEQAGVDKKELLQMRQQGDQFLAQLVASLKGPSAAVLKAQEKADKLAEGQAALSDTLSTAETLVKDLAKMGGMTSTSKSSLANLVTSLQTGTVGQMAGRTFGTQEQAKRDELKSVRLQLLNAVKEATGMSAQQLNSNVELKTYLDSLGSEGMTKEANLAILDNLSRRYLKGSMNAPAKGVGTAENPIVLK